MAEKKYTIEELVPLLVKETRLVNNKEIEVVGVPLYAQYENIGGTDSLTKPTLMEINLAKSLLNAANPKFGLTPNVKVNKAAVNLITEARKEFSDKIREKEEEIAALKAQLESSNKKGAKKNTNTSTDEQVTEQIVNEIKEV